MKTNSYTTQFTTQADPQTVFNAITQFEKWWSEEIIGSTDVLNDTFFYHYKDVHLCRIKLVEKIAAKKLVYSVLENEFNFTENKDEWIGTKLIFEIVQVEEKTKLVFTHDGLVPEYECYQVCEDAWTSYIQGSLKSLIETGVGKPNPKEGGLNEELIEKWGLPRK